jgi:serine/threonine protein kinase
MVVADLAIGSEFAGYRLEGVAGRGGMGVVYRARNLITEQQRALKVIAPQLSADEGFRERFKRESRHVAGLEHPNVIPLHEAREENGLLYLVMRYVEGSDLASVLRQQGRVETRRAIAIVQQVAAALDAAHEQGLVHRDVKPANVLLEPVKDGVEHAYLTDFGLVKNVSSDSSLSVTGVFVGTYQYAAPEQIDPSGGKRVDRRTDVYALGCVLYHVLAGEPPYPRDTVQSLIAAHLFQEPPDVCVKYPELPAQLGRVLQRAMAKEQDQRHFTAGQLARAARQAVEAGHPTPPPKLRRLATPPPPPTPAPQPQPRRAPPPRTPVPPLRRLATPPPPPPRTPVPQLRRLEPPPLPPLPPRRPRAGPSPLTVFAALVAAAGALAAIASLFVIWHMWNSAFKEGRLRVVELNGWEAFGAGDIAIAGAGLLALILAAVAIRGAGPPVLLNTLLILCGAAVAAVAIYVVAWDPEASELLAGQTGPTNRGHGPLVAGGGAALMAAGGLLGVLARRRGR